LPVIGRTTVLAEISRPSTDYFTQKAVFKGMRKFRDWKWVAEVLHDRWACCEEKVQKLIKEWAATVG